MIGWFILLTSLLGFWRVKRWERSILSTQQGDHPVASASPADEARNSAIVQRVESVFWLRSSTTPRSSGFGFPGTRGHRSRFIHADLEESLEEDAEEHPSSEREGQYIVPIDPNDEEQTGRLVRALADEARLQRDLRAAGLL